MKTILTVLFNRRARSWIGPALDEWKQVVYDDLMTYKGATSNHPFKGYRAYGPYLSKTEGRRVIVLVPPKGSELRRTTISYARFKYSRKIGQPVSKEFEVDHIDDNKLNDKLSNLQLLTRLHNTRKSHPGCTTMVELKCPVCNNKFSRRRGQTHLVPSNSSRKHTCCSKECSHVQKGRTLRAKNKKK